MSLYLTITTSSFDIVNIGQLHTCELVIILNIFISLIKLLELILLYYYFPLICLQKYYTITPHLKNDLFYIHKSTDTKHQGKYLIFDNSVARTGKIALIHKLYFKEKRNAL